jgi:RHS repeat-associated protein
LIVKKGGGVLVKKTGTIKQTPQQFSNVTIKQFIYHLTDHLSGSNVDVDEQGNVLEAIDYYPFGSARVDDKTGGYENNYKNTGKELDDETNLYYYGARYYDAGMGRFVSQDPAYLSLGVNNFEKKYNRTLKQHLSNPQCLNSYGYANNNPLTYRDENGEILPLIAAGAVALYAVAEAGLSAYDAYSTFQTLNSNASAGEKTMAVGLFVGGLVGPGAGYKTAAGKVGDAIKAVDKISDSSKLADGLSVCRGGLCSAERFEKGSGVIKNSDGTLSGVSVTSKTGATEKELIQNLPGNYGQYGLTTVGNIRKLGGEVIKDVENTYHATVNNLTAKQLESLFNPTQSTKNILKYK